MCRQLLHPTAMAGILGRCAKRHFEDIQKPLPYYSEWKCKIHKEGSVIQPLVLEEVMMPRDRAPKPKAEWEDAAAILEKALMDKLDQYWPVYRNCVGICPLTIGLPPKTWHVRYYSTHIGRLQHIIKHGLPGNLNMTKYYPVASRNSWYTDIGIFASSDRKERLNMYANLICVINANHEHNAIIKPICFLVEVRYEQELVWQNRYLSPHYGTFSW